MERYFYDNSMAECEYKGKSSFEQYVDDAFNNLKSARMSNQLDMYGISIILASVIAFFSLPGITTGFYGYGIGAFFIVGSILLYTYNNAEVTWFYTDENGNKHILYKSKGIINCNYKYFYPGGLVTLLKNGKIEKFDMDYCNENYVEKIMLYRYFSFDMLKDVKIEGINTETVKNKNTAIKSVYTSGDCSCIKFSYGIKDNLPAYSLMEISDLLVNGKKTNEVYATVYKSINKPVKLKIPQKIEDFIKKDFPS